LRKKRFKDGLESLFGDVNSADTFQTNSPLLKSKGTAVKAPKGRDKSDDTTMLSDMLRDKLTEKLVEKAEENSTAKQGSPRLSGLDALIRRTIEKGKIEVNSPPRGQRRVTFVVDEELLEKLRSIARMEKKYLRELVDDAVRDFIQTYKV